MSTVRKSDEYQVGLVLKGIDELIRELERWYPKSELDDEMNRGLYQMAFEKLSLDTDVDQSIVDESIMSEKVERDFKYIDRVQHLRSMRTVFEGSRNLSDVPKSIQKMTQGMFAAVIVQKIALTFPSPIRPHEIDATKVQGNISSIYHYIGALSVLRPPNQPISMTYPFDF